MPDGLQWMAEPGTFDLGYGILLSKNLRPDDLVLRLGADPGQAQVLSRVDVGPLEDDLGSREQLVRIGECGAWTFAFAESGPVGRFPGSLEAASIDTEAISAFRTINGLSRISCAENGAVVVDFEPGADPELIGDLPPRFAEEFRRVGLLAPQPPFGVTAMRLAYKALESIFEASVPRDAVVGELPAVRVSL